MSEQTRCPKCDAPAQAAGWKTFDPKTHKLVDAERFVFNPRAIGGSDEVSHMADRIEELQMEKAILRKRYEELADEARPFINNPPPEEIADTDMTVVEVHAGQVRRLQEQIERV